MPSLRLAITKIEPDMESFALAQGTSLGAASARDHVLLQTTGAGFHESHFLTEKPQEILLPLPSAKWNGELFNISNRAQLLATVTRTGVAINGTVCSTVSAQTAVPLQLLLAGKEEAVLDHGAIPMTQAAQFRSAAKIMYSRTARVCTQLCELAGAVIGARSTQCHRRRR